MPEAPPRALLAGLCTLDVIQSVERMPGPNEKTVAQDFLVAAGGPATNAAVAIAHLGGDATVLTRLPEHALTRVILDDLEQCGVTVTNVGGVTGAPVTASILVTRATGERAVVSPSSAAGQTGRDPIAPPSLEGVGVVLVDGYLPDLALPLARSARASAVPVVLDAGSLKPHTASVAREADVVIASQDFATPHGSREPADVFAWLRSLGVERVAITRGADPVLWQGAAGAGEVAVAPVTVVDTLGAGDFFHGGFAWRIATLGMDDARFADDLAWAARAVAPSLTSFGTRAWLAR